MKYQGHKIMAVTPGSIAEELELEPGDVLLTIDGEELEDIFDYDYMTDAESFVKEFFQLIEESLENDKYVKIRGLGLSKLIDVERRESVNINTGERFEIQGHTKV